MNTVNGQDTTAPAAISLRGITKRFGQVWANRDVNLDIAKGTIHGIVGENGAGKSTLMSILYGFYHADQGEIRVNGNPCPIHSSEDAIEAGIGMVHQHFMLVDNFTVLENVVLGAEGGFTLSEGIAKARDELERLERDYSLNVPLDELIENLAVGLQQRVEILKALFRGADILILDEPTGVLTPAEADHLFRILRQLKDQGKTIILVTHKLREIMAVTDAVSVMRQGELVATRKTAETSPEALAELMVGRRVLLSVEKSASEPGRKVLELANLTVTDNAGVTRVDDVGFSVRAGEIVGIAGVAGNGQSELIEALTGLRPLQNGMVSINGKEVGNASKPVSNIRGLGMAHVPEDRHRMGLVTSFDAAENIILGYQDEEKYQSGWLLNRPAILEDAGAKMEHFDVRPRNPNLKTSLFSGGNQQKLVLAREIEHDPDLLIVGQPTRGVDIGAIEFIHRRIIEMRDAGKAVLLISVELDEIRALSDRVLVMFAGKIVGERPPETPEAELGLLMAGIQDGKAA
ncbi:MAG: ABC transporter ATP-binding protein [Hyphomicrobiales bacterium]